MTRRILLTLSLSTVLLMAATANANVVGNSRVGRTGVYAYSTDSYSNMSFWAGERAVVTVRGNGYTPMHLRVFDQNGHLITDDICQRDDCQVAWTPRWTGPFRITVQNLGSVENYYSMWVD